MHNLSLAVSTLFSIRDTAHRLHLKAKSFSQHVALGDFYEKLIELTDDLAETGMGKYGQYEQPATVASFDSETPVEFIRRVTEWLQSEKEKFATEDSFLVNIWDEITALAFRARYKLENLA